MLQFLKVHHATSEGLLFQLGEGKGFGRLSREDLGGAQDGGALGERVLNLLSSNTSAIPVIVTEARDKSGYQRVSTDLADISSAVLTLPRPAGNLLRSLFRKTTTCSIGTHVSVSVAKVSPQGTLVTLPSGILGAVIDAVPASLAEGDTLNVCPLDLDQRGIAVVAAGLNPEELTGGLIAGSTADCTVVYASDSCVCVVARSLCGTKSAVGYIAHDPKKAATTEPVPTRAGERFQCTVLFAPGDWLSRYTPIVMLTQSTRATPDDCRTINNTFGGVTGVSVPYPWRYSAANARRQQDGEEPESRMKRRRMEEMIDEYERDPHHIPSSAEEFKKQLLGNPNSSFLWTQYMAFHLALNQTEKGRIVAEDALKTIGVRLAKEHFNVWVSYLNLENLHGTKESLGAVFKRALSYSEEPQKLFLALADIYDNSGKNQSLVEHCRLMTSKYCTSKAVWIRFGCVLAKQQKRDALKRLLREMTQTLTKQDQVDVVKSVAIFDFKNHSLETGRALFEGLVAKVPKRSDIWQCYLDQECSAILRGDTKASIDAARTLFERVSTLSLPPRVMQLHLTRYLEFERQNGSNDLVETVKQKARAYVESKMQDISSPAQE